jgi:hydrogenase expression/formation protein HypD
MKYLEEFRDEHQVKKLLDEIHSLVTREWQIMEICGGQTHSLVKNGILNLLPDKIIMVHGPGCPVCVTPIGMIDKAVELALKEGVILCSFGDMVRVPGSEMSLLKAKALGADIRIVYSPLDALKIARENLGKEIVFFAVGFETTAPANALSVVHARKAGIINYSILTSHVLVPPAMEAILSDDETRIDGFLAAGHVCTIMGSDEYEPIAKKYKVPVIITGFEPVDLLNGIKACVEQLEQGSYDLDNQYKRVVKRRGNKEAQSIIFEIFEIGEREWRGIGKIPSSGYQVRKEYSTYDAMQKFSIESVDGKENPDCMAGQILKGLKKPNECPLFGNKCTPSNPQGAPMVSSEGACAAYYHFGYEPGAPSDL